MTNPTTTDTVALDAALDALDNIAARLLFIRTRATKAEVEAQQESIRIDLMVARNAINQAKGA